MSTPAAVLFDFSGTLFRLEEDESWFTDLRVGDDEKVDGHFQAELMRRMTQPVGSVVTLDDDGHRAWEARDLDPAMHRAAYLAVLEASGVRRKDHAESLYDKVIDPDSWTAYPDTARVVRGLAEKNIPIAVVSNIAFDLRPAFDHLGVGHLITYYSLSFEVGAVKPDPAIFRAAVDALGVPAQSCLMVGDSEEADGGARALGMSFGLVDPLPTDQRPSALVDVVTEHGLRID
ncbi:haloacid dehalogenase [Rhodococcus sp. Leaf7]|uniref:HAD family hydrolase n=1 Tax=unclassified Rhodococcus (in: high G+C Gram-positive bacteria) TaxID=192944 RepID=UPI0006FBB50D|nr:MULTISPECIES: HAD-IA family hydrolase [unclassified Rhodococcus (in: high G+C Gram-positive bacteria)]KQU02920.1 haloacid dehalogenase [Rhodococcus sp. Leaf7]KQU38719.1 haloacid dehalogenase [Rhodococcus sp. Leaf247]